LIRREAMRIANRPTTGIAHALSIALVMVLGVAIFTPVAQAETPFEFTDCWSAKVTMLSQSKELTILSSDVLGMTMSENKLFNNLTSNCLCLRSYTGAKQKGTCYSKFMDADGDFFITEAVRTGTEVGPESTWKFLEGTGKFKGITGGGKSSFTASNAKRPIRPGMLQGRLKMVGTFELPK
jgi:hypothetical protein